MHGIIFMALEDFVTEQLGDEGWNKVQATAGLPYREYGPEEIYPDQEAELLMAAAAVELEMDLSRLQRELGRHMAPGLVDMARSVGMVEEGWRTLDFVEHAAALHQAVLGDGNLLGDKMRTLRLKYGEAAIAYRSPRRMCHLIKGILEGLGELFDEPLRYEEPVCMDHGAPLCRFALLLDDPELQRKVDVVREFAQVKTRGERLSFFSRYQGVPIAGSADLLSYSANGIKVSLSRELAAALKAEKTAYFSISHLPVGLVADVNSVDKSRGQVELVNLRLAEGAMGRRADSRVAPGKPVPVRGHIAGQLLNGSLLNVSQGGVSVLVDAAQGLEELVFQDVQVTFALPFDWVEVGDALALGAQEMTLHGNLLEVLPAEGDQRVIRVVFSLVDEDNRYLLTQFVQLREDQALPELRRAAGP